MGGTQLISQTRGSTTNYFLQDGQNSTRALTNSSGNVTDTYSYTAFGELFNQTGSTTNSYLYTGQQFDSLTGLYDLRARYYNPALGRFLSEDTYPYNFSNPVELNRYVYTANDPINLFDPSGHVALTEYAINLAKNGAVVGALFGVGSTIACGGNLIGNVLFGALAGAGFGIAFAYYPLTTQAAGIMLGGMGAGSAIHDGVVNGWNKCNTFNAVTSLLGVALSGWSLVNDSLSGLGGIGYYDEMLNPSMGHGGYYSDIEPISIGWYSNPTRLARVIQAEHLSVATSLARPGEEFAFVAAAEDIAGINTSRELSHRLFTLNQETGRLIEGPLAVLEFDTPSSGLASPVDWSYLGFSPSGYTLGGAREFLLPNLLLSDLRNLTIRIVP